MFMILKKEICERDYYTPFLTDDPLLAFKHHEDGDKVYKIPDDYEVDVFNLKFDFTTIGETEESLERVDRDLENRCKGSQCFHQKH